MAKIRVQILNVTVPSSMQDPGGVFLDIGDTDLSVSRVAEELNEINEIRYGGVRKFNVPATAKNKIIFQQFIAVQPHEFDYEPLECRIYVDANILEETKIGASGHTEGQFIECVATKAQDYWLIGATALRLPQIPYDDIEFTQANIETNWTGNYRYGDGDIGIHFTPMYFGKPYQERTMTIEYMRWNYHLLRLYREGFRTFGWNFECELLETDPGRQIAGYLIDPNAYSREELIAANRARAESGEINRNKQYTVSVGGLGPLFGLLGILTAKPTYGYHFVILHNTVLNDPGKNFKGGRYYGFGRFRFTLTIQYIPKDLAMSTVRVEFYRNNPPPPIQKPTKIYEEQFSPLDDYIGDIDVVQEKVIEAEVNLQLNQSITVSTYGESRKKSIKIKNTFVSIEPLAVFPQRGETINPATYLRNDTLLQCLKGWVHAMRGKIDVVPGERTVRVLPNYETNFLGEDLEGYYTNNLVDVRPYQVKDGVRQESPAAKPNRYQLIRFKESTDAAILKLGMDDLTPLFSKTVDLGAHFKPEYTEHANPYFEPTINDWVYDFSPPDGENVPVNLPMLLDHDPSEEEPHVSTNIGPRLLFLTEFRPQTWEDDSGSHAVELNWMSGAITTFNHAWMRNPHLPSATEQDNLVFEDPDGVIENTLWTRLWRGWLYANLMSSRLSVLALIDGGQFFNWNFRDAYQITYDGKVNICNLVAIDDFLPASGISTPCIFIPRGFSSLVGSDDGGEGDPCDTYTYSLEIQKSGTTYTFVVTTDNPDSGTLEWRYEGASSWTTGSSVSDPTGPFYVRYTAGGDCPDTIVKYIDPCGNYPTIQIEYEVNESGEDCVTAEIGGILIDTVTGTDLEYELDNSDTWTAYTPGTQICGDYDVICFRGTVEFDSACEDYTIEETCFEIPPNQDCNQNFPEIVITHRGLDSFSFDVGGNFLSTIGEFHFWYKKVGEEDWEAKLWTDQAPIVGTNYLVKLFISWCDDCPPYCSEWTTVEEPSALMAAMISGEEWDFSKVPSDRKKDIIDRIYRGDRAGLARIHNELELSPYEYCCGKDLQKVMNWFYHGLKQGHFDEE